MGLGFYMSAFRTLLMYAISSMERGAAWVSPMDLALCHNLRIFFKSLIFTLVIIKKGFGMARDASARSKE
jgi:hypothetical protein